MQYQPDLADAKLELQSFAGALRRHPKRFAETFVTAASPGIISTTFLRDPANPDYRTDREYVYGLARAMRKATMGRAPAVVKGRRASARSR